MKKGLALATAALCSCAMTSVAQAAPDDISLKLTAGRGNADDTRSIGRATEARAQWTRAEAETGAFSVALSKNVPTSEWAFAAIVVKGVEGKTVAQLGEIGFSVKGDCTSGSPRFNLYYDNTNDGEADGVAFYGCGNHGGAPGDQWSHVLADASAPDGGYSYDPLFGPLTMTDASEVVQLAILADEQGTSYVDNVIAAGETAGEPNRK